MATNMEQLVAAFAAMSGNDGNLQAAPPLVAPPVQMEDLVAAFAASVTVSGNNNVVATDPAGVPSYDCQETMSTDDNNGEPTKGEEVCVLRVRFPDGRVLCKSFGAGLPIAALFRYCRSALLAGGASARGRAFRLVKLAGGASDEVRASSSTTFRDLGLHHCTVHVVPD